MPNLCLCWRTPNEKSPSHDIYDPLEALRIDRTLDVPLCTMLTWLRPRSFTFVRLRVDFNRSDPAGILRVKWGDGPGKINELQEVDCSLMHMRRAIR